MCGGGGRISPRAVARLVLPEEVGPERARRMGGGGVRWEGGEVLVVGWWLSGPEAGSEVLEAGMVWEEGEDQGLGIGWRCDGKKKAVGIIIQ